MLDSRGLGIDALLHSERKNSQIWLSNGLKFNFRENFEGQFFADVFQLAMRASKYEQLLKDRDKRPCEDFIKNMSFAEKYELYDEFDQEKIQQRKIKFADDKGAHDHSFLCKIIRFF